MRSRTIALLLFFTAALTGLVSCNFYNRQILPQINSGQPPSQNPSKVPGKTPTQISSRCAKNTIQDKTYSPITSQTPTTLEADTFFEKGKKQHENYTYKEALENFEIALKFYQEEQNFKKKAITLGSIGTVYHNKADYKKAIDCYTERLNIAEKINDSKEKAAALSSLGDAYYLMGNYPRAREFYEDSLAVPEKGDRARAIALGGLGSVYLSLGDYKRATNLHMERLKVINETLEKNQELTKEERKEFSKLKGAALGSLGHAHHMQRSYEEAMANYIDHLEIAKDNDDKPGVAIALGELASAYHSRWKRDGYKNDSSSKQAINCYEAPSKKDSDLGQAINCYEQRLQIAQEIDDRRLVASTHGGLGGIYYSIANLKRPPERFQESLDFYDKTIKSTENYLTTSEIIEDLPGIGNAKNLLGVSYFQISEIRKAQNKSSEAQENLNKAIQNLEGAISVRESLRKGLTETEKVFIFDTQQTTYLNLQQVYISNNQPELALEVAERGRARAFVDVLAKQLKTDRENSAILNIQDIKKIAQEQQATLVVYSHIKKENSIIGHNPFVYIWAVKPNQEKVVFKQVDLDELEKHLEQFKQKLPPGDRPANLIGSSILRAQIRSNKKDTNEVESDKQISKKDITDVLIKYYQTLIDPKETDPKRKDLKLLSKEDEKVIFIPQGALFEVPFAALYDTKEKQYLIEKYAILVAPSIQTLDIIRERQRNREFSGNFLENKDWLILGIEDAKPKKFCSQEVQLDKLPGAAKEAKDIAFNLFQGKAMEDKTEAAVKQKMPQARMIHLATHGLLNNCEEYAEVPGAIALDALENDDGWLTASEISQMKLQAELIVLSACDTALGRLTGDGVIGLSRSALTAGSSSAIVSLWNVDDNSTAFLMTEFYKQLKEQSQSGKLDRALALRQAMLNTKNYVDKNTKKKIYSEPYQWSAFTLVGEATTQLENHQ
ncbi:MAG: CHAT domain-containing protein [Symplocastrum torsivum CPER-KK1]|jgi:CHAT domain-containing protein/tetratricopeptide (TPR) repeat protein|uniref:CHAT domain-containing protein n=1 Tax=Symplocastrum torsivum CPER-KK1 TaxID=450513 RepID=A0A951PT21_9CYAN|nr:CHAT domain-containing protein [Symplocastrum torsivum CPER-KK1]